MTQQVVLPKRRRKPADKLLLTVVLLLLMAGLVTLFSATYYTAQDRGDAFSAVRKQLLGVLIGGVAMVATSRIPYRFWARHNVALGALLAALALLALTLIPGIGRELNGSRRWLGVGSFTFQPSELAKYAMTLFLALALAARGNRVRTFFRGIVPVLVAPCVMFLLILEQPNLSTAGTILISAALMIMVAGAKWRHMAVLGAGGAAAFLYYAWSEPYRRERLLSFTDPFAKMADEGYQLSQSLIAFGSGGLFGMGLGQGRQKYAYLPYPESDFIFAIVGEDFGLVGCVVVVLLFVTLLLAGMRIALNCEDKFGCLLATGIICVIVVQAFINMGVVVGLLPTTGLPLPFFSSGGTSLSITMAAIGIVLNISRDSAVNLG